MLIAGNSLLSLVVETSEPHLRQRFAPEMRFVIVQDVFALERAHVLAKGAPLHCGWIGHFAVAKAHQHFQNFAPCGKRSTALAFVVIH